MTSRPPGGGRGAHEFAPGLPTAAVMGLLMFGAGWTCYWRRVFSLEDALWTSLLGFAIAVPMLIVLAVRYWRDRR